MSKVNKGGFTLLEIIIVIIITGVLVSLAIPALFKTVELSRIAEANVGFGTIRRAMEQCALDSDHGYASCELNNNTFTFLDDEGNVINQTSLGAEDPGTAPGAHFRYYAIGFYDNFIQITAFRNYNNWGRDPSEADDTHVYMRINLMNGTIHTWGDGFYEDYGQAP